MFQYSIISNLIDILDTPQGRLLPIPITLAKIETLLTKMVEKSLETHTHISGLQTKLRDLKTATDATQAKLDATEAKLSDLKTATEATDGGIGSDLSVIKEEV